MSKSESSSIYLFTKIKDLFKKQNGSTTNLGLVKSGVNIMDPRTNEKFPSDKRQNFIDSSEFINPINNELKVYKVKNKKYNLPTLPTQKVQAQANDKMPLIHIVNYSNNPTDKKKTDPRCNTHLITY